MFGYFRVFKEYELNKHYLLSVIKMKQQLHDKLNVRRTRKKSEPQMGFEPTTLHDDLVGCSNP